MKDLTKNGALASQHIQGLIDDDVLLADISINQDQIQPASIDLRLGATAYRVRASFLPGRGKSVVDCLNEMVMHKIDLIEGAVLEKGCVYIVPLLEELDLPEYLSAAANPKSSTGRLDVFTRLITDSGIEFEQVPAGYQGELYAEIVPLTFSVLVRQGSSLSQLRFRSGKSVQDDELHKKLQDEHRLVDANLNEDLIRNGVPVSVDLSGQDDSGLIGYRAKRHAAVIDIDRKATYPAADFWEPLYTSALEKGQGQLILDPGEFYILVSKEAVHVPIDYAAEMIPYDALVGEFRVHYAGFFDPGFGAPEAEGIGAKAVLEVRSFDVPFRLEHGQNVGRLVYEKMLETPDKIYGQDLKSNYQSQGLKLSKHFVV